jgi:hypothetical protein
MRVGYKLYVDGCAGRRSWEWERKSGAPSDGCCGGHMRHRNSAASFSRCLRGDRGHVSTVTSTSAKRGGILMRGCLVGKIPPEPNAKASTLE